MKLPELTHSPCNPDFTRIYVPEPLGSKFYQHKQNLQPKTKLYNHLALQFLDFQLKSFVDPKPVEL